MSTNLLALTLIICFAMNEATNQTIKTKNLAFVTWEHAVNNKMKLENTLKSDIQMLEADVLLGNLTNSPDTNIPIMAHPPALTSDLTLENFLNNVNDFNAKNPQAQKGIKLDFKSIEAFTASIPILRNRNIDQFPVWLNADIIKGPGDPRTTTPVDPHKFLAQSKQFPNATLSVGWTTNYNQSTVNATYTRDDVTLMLDTLKTEEVNQSITFPVRAVYAAESAAELTELIGNCSGATLTVWSAETDPVDVKNLRKMILDIGLDKIYVDVPKMLMDQLDLSGTGRPTLGLLSVVLSAFLVLFNYF